MDRSELIAAILSGNRDTLRQVLPKQYVITPVEIEKAFNYVCENGSPNGSAYYWAPKLQEEDLPKALHVFNVVVNNRTSDTAYFEGLSREEKNLFFRLIDFFKEHYHLIEPGRFDGLFEPPYGRIIYKPHG